MHDNRTVDDEERREFQNQKLMTEIENDRFCLIANPIQRSIWYFEMHEFIYSLIFFLLPSSVVRQRLMIWWKSLNMWVFVWFLLLLTCMSNATPCVLHIRFHCPFFIPLFTFGHLPISCPNWNRCFFAIIDIRYVEKFDDDDETFEFHRQPTDESKKIAFYSGFLEHKKSEKNQTIKLKLISILWSAFTFSIRSWVSFDRFIWAHHMKLNN